MSKIDETYHGLLEEVWQEGFEYEDPKRTGVKRLQIPSYRLEHDFKDGFPAIATKKLAWKSVVSELMWFLKGDQNIKYLLDHNNPIWNKDAYAHYVRLFNKHTKGLVLQGGIDEFLRNTQAGSQSAVVPAYKYGDLGPVYGKLWRTFPSDEYDIDQIEKIVYSMMEEPMSTEHIVMAWDPGSKEHQALPPCHFGFQVMMRPLDESQRIKLCKDFDILESRKLSRYISGPNVPKNYREQILNTQKIPKYGFELIWQQRSVDVFLGLPFNIASYALLAHVLGKMTNSVPLKITGDLRNVHLYDNSIDAAAEQASRDVNAHGKVNLLMKDEFHYICDDLKIGVEDIIEELRPDMFKLYNYHPDPAIKVEMLERN